MRNWRVFATARRLEDVKMLSDFGFESCQLDLEDPSSIKEAVNYALSKTNGKLDALVNNAGFGLTAAVEDLTREELRKQFEVNVFGLVELTNLIIPAFRKQGYGRIVNISSMAGRFSLPYMGAYSASKFALEALSDAMRLELCGTKIYVSLIEPGLIKTNFSRNALSVLEELQNKDKSCHSKIYNTIMHRRKDKNKESRKLPALTVAKKILHALESKRPASRYLIAPEAYIFSFSKKFLPEGLIDFIAMLYMRKYRR